MAFTLFKKVSFPFHAWKPHEREKEKKDKAKQQKQKVDPDRKKGLSLSKGQIDWPPFLG